MAKSTKTALKGMCERLCEKASEERAMEKKKVQTPKVEGA